MRLERRRWFGIIPTPCSPKAIVSSRRSFRRARLDADAKSVLFSGGMPDAGTTSVVLNLASTAAAAGRSVAVVDANFRRPKIASMLGLDPKDPGLGDILCEGREIDSVISKTSDGISVIPAGTSDEPGL